MFNQSLLTRISCILNLASSLHILRPKLLPIYNKALDGIRGISVLVVIMAHTQVIHFGWLGVQAFFVLSGFLITSILFKEKEKNITLGHKFKNFWMRRVLRIFPLYYLYLLFLIILWWQTDQWSSHAGTLPYLFTYTYNLSHIFQSTRMTLVPHLWSLSVEEQFYLLYPFIILLFNLKQIRIIVVAGILIAIIYRLLTAEYLLHHDTPEIKIGGFIYSATVSQCDAFLLGASIIIFRLNRISLRKKYIIFAGWLLLTVFAGLQVFLYLRHGHFSFSDYITHLGYTPDFIRLKHHIWSYTTIDVLVMLLILILTDDSKSRMHRMFTSIFRFQPFASIGKISYGMYITQAGIVLFVTSFLDKQGIYNRYIICLFSVLITYCLAYVLYNYYEKRFLALKSRFR